MLRSIYSELQDLFRYRWVTYMSVTTTLKTRYRRSVLGFVWSLLGPLVNYGTLAVVFYYGTKVGNKSYFAYVFPGILFFNFFSTCLVNSAGLFLANEQFLKKIYLPKSIFLLNASVSELINFVFNCSALFLLSWAFGFFQFNSALFILPVVVVLLFFFVFGISLILATATVFFRDLIHIVPIVAQALFYVTPVLYFPEILPETFQKFVFLNPVYYFVMAFREPIYLGKVPNLELLSTCAILSLASVLGGFLLLKKFDNKIIFRL